MCGRRHAACSLITQQCHLTSPYRVTVTLVNLCINFASIKSRDLGLSFSRDRKYSTLTRLLSWLSRSRIVWSQRFTVATWRMSLKRYTQPSPFRMLLSMLLSASSAEQGGLTHNNNNNNNNHDNVYGAVIMAEPSREFTRFI